MADERRKYMSSREPGDSFLDQARKFVQDYFNVFAEKTDDFYLELEDVYVVWGCKTLQNWKALVSTNVPDGMYYEVTHNGEKRETYIDAYKKVNNVCIKDVEEVPQP
jgi:hypothetical protein